MKRFLLSILLFGNGIVYSQLVENFSDGDFLNNPLWQGDTSSWQVVAGSLKSTNSVANSQFYLSTSSKIVKNTEWRLQANLSFNTSSVNYVDFYLASDSSNIKAGVKNGYFVRIGGVKDEICLYKRVNGVNTLIIDGLDGTTNKSSNSIALKITCSNQFQWNLERNLAGVSGNYVNEGFAMDSSIKSSNWAGILVAQSTASFFQKHVFDDISVSPILKDTSAPKLQTIGLVETLNPLKITFDEAVDSVWLNTYGSITLLDKYGVEVSLDKIVKDSLDVFSYYLFFRDAQYEAGQYILLVYEAKDTKGNAAKGSQASKVVYQIPSIASYKQIVITELMTDPVPSVGLPEKEYVEIFNNTKLTFNLKDYVLSDPSTSVKLPTYFLQSNEYLILCKTSDTADFSPYGHVLPLNTMPSLNNSSDIVSLKNTKGKVVDKAAYFLSWYKDSQKDDGGYALELIDPTNYCLESDNWKASSSLIGGTPGIQNSVFGVLKDTIAPTILGVNVISSNEIEVLFSEKVDSILFKSSNFSFNPLLGIQTVGWNSDSLDRLRLAVVSNLPSGVEIVLKVNELRDCAGNKKLNASYSFALSEIPTSSDVLVNEVLFNPLPYGADFVEIYNASGKFIDMKGWMLANLKNDTIANKKVLFKNSFILKPSEYLVVTEDKNNILNTFVRSRADRIFEVPVLPTFYDDLGNVILIDAANNVIDRFDYDQSMHSVLVSKKEGVSLEKINPTLETNNASNWTSASKESGYATPGYANSQYVSLGISDEDISIEPQLITPNGDGDKDFMVFRIQTDKIASLRNIMVFDVMGREVKRLLKNGYAGTQTLVQWDGTDEANNLLPLGHYIVWFEAVDKSGNILHYKKKVVVGNRF